MAKEVKRGAKSPNRVKSQTGEQKLRIAIAADLADDLQTIAASRGLSTPEYVDTILRPVIGRDMLHVIEKIGERYGLEVKKVEKAEGE